MWKSDRKKCIYPEKATVSQSCMCKNMYTYSISCSVFGISWYMYIYKLLQDGRVVTIYLQQLQSAHHMYHNQILPKNDQTKSRNTNIILYLQKHFRAFRHMITDQKWKHINLSIYWVVAVSKLHCEWAALCKVLHPKFSPPIPVL